MVLDMEEGVVLGQHRNQDLAKPIHVPQVEANAAFWEYSAANQGPVQVKGECYAKQIPIMND